MAKISEIFKRILIKLGLLKNEPKKIEEPKDNFELNRNFSLTRNSGNQISNKELLTLQKLDTNFDTLYQIMKLYPEIEDEFETIMRRNPTDELSFIYQGNIQFPDRNKRVYAIQETKNQDKTIIFIPEEGIQEVTIDDEKERYEIRIKKRTFSIESKKMKNGVKQTNMVFFLKETPEEDSFYVLIDSLRRNKFKDFKINNKEEYFASIIKNTGLLKKESIGSVTYSELYKNRKDIRPEQLLLNIGEENFLYEFDEKTGKYINILNPNDSKVKLNPDKTQFTLEEFEENIDAKYGIPSISKSSLNGYFNKGNFQIPIEIKQIIERIKKLENKEKDGNEMEV